MPKLLTIDDICRELGIGRATAYQLVRKIRHTKVGRRILVEESELFDYIRDNSRDDKNQNENKK